MDLNKFNNIYWNKLLDIIWKENKTVFLLDDFNIDFLKYEKYHKWISWFTSSNMFAPYILYTARIHGQSRSSIDNIFSNQYNRETISGNLTSTIFDRLPQFLLFHQFFLICIPLNQICIKGTGLNLTRNIFYWTILRKIDKAS